MCHANTHWTIITIKGSDQYSCVKDFCKGIGDVVEGLFKSSENSKVRAFNLIKSAVFHQSDYLDNTWSISVVSEAFSDSCVIDSNWGTNLKIMENSSKIPQHVHVVETALIFVHVLTDSTAVRVYTLPNNPAEMQTNRQPRSSVPLSLPWNACDGTGVDVRMYTHAHVCRLPPEDREAQADKMHSIGTVRLCMTTTECRCTSWW